MRHVGIARVGRSVGRLHDVREHDRRKHSVDRRRDRSTAGAREELLDVAQALVVIRRPPAGVEVAVDHHLRRAGNVLGQVIAVDEVDDRIVALVDDQRRGLDEREERCQVELGAAAKDLDRDGRRAAVALEPRQLRHRLVDVGGMLHQGVQHEPGGPELADKREDLLESRVWWSRPGTTRHREHQRRDSIGMLRREHGGQRRSVRHAGDGRPFEPDRVHDHADVVHPILDRAGAQRTVRQAGAALVEDHHSGELGQAIERRAGEQVVPVQLHVRHEPGHVDEVDGSIADDLVRNAQVAVLRELRLGFLVHPGLTDGHPLGPCGTEATSTPDSQPYGSRRPCMCGGRRDVDGTRRAKPDRRCWPGCRARPGPLVRS